MSSSHLPLKGCPLAFIYVGQRGRCGSRHRCSWSCEVGCDIVLIRSSCNVVVFVVIIVEGFGFVLVVVKEALWYEAARYSLDSLPAFILAVSSLALFRL